MEGSGSWEEEATCDTELRAAERRNSQARAFSLLCSLQAERDGAAQGHEEMRGRSRVGSGLLPRLTVQSSERRLQRPGGPNPPPSSSVYAAVTGLHPSLRCSGPVPARSQKRRWVSLVFQNMAPDTEGTM